jgi:hypothetical protein
VLLPHRQSFPGGNSLTDSRIQAALILSPSGGRERLGKSNNFAKVSIPWMLMTGTKDTAPIGDVSVENRLTVFPQLQASGTKYELVLDGAEHSVFTETRLPGEKDNRNPKHHPTIMALSTAFWDTWLKQDAAAKTWLHGEDARSVLTQQDRWQLK